MLFLRKKLFSVLEETDSIVNALEKKLHSKLHRGLCSWHKNELKFRPVFKYVDDTIRSLTPFTGTRGKLCEREYHYLPQVQFRKTSDPLEDITLIVKMGVLTNVKRLLLEYTIGMFKVKVNSTIAALKNGPLSNSRWLTLPTSLMCI